MIALILRLFDCFSWLLRGLGVDYPQFRAILQTKLMLDVRRPRAHSRNGATRIATCSR